jgi:glycosyltransferase involved in cell wall biosynthesis
MVHVLLATYNGERYLKEQIESILNQTYKKIKIIIRDDGSKDETLEIVDQYINDYPGIIINITQNECNCGVAYNFLKLLEYSSAEYIMFCDQDDIWLPNKIELSLNRIKELECKFNIATPILIHTDMQVVDENLNLISGSFWNYQLLSPDIKSLNRLLIQNHVTGCTMMINKALRDISLPAQNGIIMHDWWIALVAATFGQIDYVNAQTMLYRQHTCNVEGAKKWCLISKLKRMVMGAIPFILNNTDWKICLLKTQQQAENFLKRYRGLINDSQNEILKTYIDLETLSFLSRKITWIKYGYFQYGLLNNLSLLFII